MMVSVAAVEVWFEGGPIAGRYMPVEVTADGRLPVAVVLPQRGVYVGSNDEPAPAAEHRYVLVEDSSAEMKYRYDGTVELPTPER